MKTRLTNALIQRAALLLLSTLCSDLSVFAQGTAFTYQGRLNDAGQAANGIYDLRFEIYDLPGGGIVVGGPLTNAATVVSNGLFNVALDFGANVFTGADRWLDIGVRTNGPGAFIPLSPRQKLTPAPYAITAGNVTGVVPSGSVAGTYSSAVTFNNAANQFTGSFYGNGGGLSNLNALTLGGLASSNFWRLDGNLVAPGQFLGSTNNQPLELRANGGRALRLEPNTNGAPNVIGGSPLNQVDAGVVGATIGGGGAINHFGFAYTNRVAADFGAIGGGAANAIQGTANSAVIAGGYTNTIQFGASLSAIVGGYGNLIETNAAVSSIAGGSGNVIQRTVFGANIGGGYGNTNGSAYSSIAAGLINRIHTDSSSSSIGGGYLNTIHTNSGLSVISGGQENIIEANASLSAIGGGWLNLIQAGADQSVVAGGNAGRILSGARESFIGSGFANTIQTNAGGAFIGGGFGNTNSAVAGVIAGGGNNFIGANSEASTVAGGTINSIGTNSSASTIAGGSANSISNFSSWATIGGGIQNSVRRTYGTVAGGRENTAAWTYATVGGGFQNLASGNFNLPNGDSATVAGGYQNTALGNNAVVAGGAFNYARGDNAAISGGWYNTNQTGNGFIGGGESNLVDRFSQFSVVAGGAANVVRSNSPHSVIAGGNNNVIGTNAAFAVVVGGRLNSALGTNSLAAGRRAKANHQGTFVWADSTDADFISSGSNQFLIRASGGVGIGTTNPTAPLEVMGAVKAGTFQGNGSQLSNVNAVLLGGIASSNVWQLGGNNVAPGQFLGSLNDQPLDLRVNGMRGLRIEFGGDSTTDANVLPDGAPNIVGGAPNNSVPAGVVGVTIAGGGTTNYFGGASPNTAAADFATIGGGSGNAIDSNSVNAVITGGRGNRIEMNAYAATVSGDRNRIEAAAFGATVAGGGFNRIQTNATAAVISGGANNLVGVGASHSIIGGGLANTNLGYVATISGGVNNLDLGGLYSLIGGGRDNQVASGSTDAVIVGGRLNRAAGVSATVPGGYSNSATANYSFAAGNRAKANHPGSFVWADSQSADFLSTSNNQFSVRAAGGVQLNDDTSLFFGHQTRQMLNLWDTRYALGVQSYGHYSRTDYGASFYWFEGGEHSDFSGDPGAGGARLMRLDSIGLHLDSNAAGHTPAVYLNHTGANGRSFRVASYGDNVNPGSFIVRDDTAGADRLTIDANGNVGIGTNAPNQRLVVAGNIYASGTIIPNSDRNLKTDFAPVDAASVLERVVSLPIQQWRFKAEAGNVKHVGPMAQDFREAFGLGAHETAIATVDADGVALAAIQGLNQKVEQKNAEIAELKRELENLKQAVNQLVNARD